MSPAGARCTRPGLSAQTPRLIAPCRNRPRARAVQAASASSSSERWLMAAKCASAVVIQEKRPTTAARLSRRPWRKPLMFSLMVKIPIKPDGPKLVVRGSFRAPPAGILPHVATGRRMSAFTTTGRPSRGNSRHQSGANLTKCSQDTAYRDVLDLVERGALRKDPGGGRSTSYSLVIDDRN